MSKFRLVAVLALAFAQPATANEMMSCDNSAMEMVQAAVDGADPSRNDQKLAATKELAMARDAMKSNNLDDCSMHLANAMNAITKN